MCRLFGFRSNVATRVHPSLVGEKNSLRAQSVEHKDGWGIAYYDGSELPEVAHGLGPAHADTEFERVSAHLSSHAVVAHVRLASVGGLSRCNAHPFVFGRWAFAHNGTLRNYALHREQLEARIAPDLRALLRGETDSERCFYLFVTALRRLAGVRQPVQLEQVAQAVRATVDWICRVTDEAGHPSSANFLVTDGRQMVASRRHRPLLFSEWKKKHARGAQAPAQGTRLEQLVIASEALSTEDHWHELPEGGLVGVDEEVRFFRWGPDWKVPELF